MMVYLDRFLASLMLLTRLPVGRLRRVPDDAFAHVTDWWSTVGWLTGAVAGGVLWLASTGGLPQSAAVVLALAARLLLTGALHEDGLADFCDGYGGGRTRDRILAIMKDSRIGSYGVLGLVLYYLTAVPLLAGIPCREVALVLFAGDPLAKFIASQQVNLLPYARPAGESKTGAVYRRMSPLMWLISAAAGLLPTLLWLPSELWRALLFPVAMMGGLLLLMHRRTGGYTGDCCGAAFLLCEWAFWLGITIVR